MQGESGSWEQLELGLGRKVGSSSQISQGPVLCSQDEEAQQSALTDLPGPLFGNVLSLNQSLGRGWG